MPSQQGVGLHDEQDALPRSQPTCKKYQYGAIGVVELGSFDLTAHNYELLAEQGILYYQHLFTTAQVRHGTSQCTGGEQITYWLPPYPTDNPTSE